MATFLQTVGHQPFATLEDFLTYLAEFQALSVREYYLYRKTCRLDTSGCSINATFEAVKAKFAMKVVNGKLIPQEYELVHTHPS